MGKSVRLLSRKLGWFSRVMYVGSFGGFGGFQYTILIRDPPMSTAAGVVFCVIPGGVGGHRRYGGERRGFPALLFPPRLFSRFR